MDVERQLDYAGHKTPVRGFQRVEMINRIRLMIYRSVHHRDSRGQYIGCHGGVVRLDVFGIHLSGKLVKLILVTNVLEYDQALGIKRFFSAAATLMRDEYGAIVH